MPDGCVIHSFRHSLRDRLRAIECPADIIDAIGGWVTEGIGHQYGQGHSLAVMHGWRGLFNNPPLFVALATTTIFGLPLWKRFHNGVTIGTDCYD